MPRTKVVTTQMQTEKMFRLMGEKYKGQCLELLSEQLHSYTDKTVEGERKWKKLRELNITRLYEIGRAHV